MKFSFKRVIAVIKVRNREFYRDFGALGWVILFPIIMVVTFGYVFDVDKGESYKLGYWGEYQTKEIPHIEWIKYANKEEAMQKLKLQRIDVAFDTTVGPYKLWSAKDSPKSKMAKQVLHLHLLPEHPAPFEEAEISGNVISYTEWVFPGIINLNMMFMGLWGVGWVIVRQRKQGILKRLKAAPLTAFEYLLAQIVSRLIVMVISTILVFIVANIIFPFDIVGSLLDALILYVLGCLALSSIGLIFAARLTSEELCNGLLNFITYPLMFISEIWFTLEGSSDFVKSLAWFSPLWQLTNGMRQILYEGTSLYALKGTVLFLILTTLLFTSVGSFLFKWNKD